MAELRFDANGQQAELLRAVIGGKETFFMAEPMNGGSPMLVLVARGDAIVAVKSLLTGRPQSEIQSTQPDPEEEARRRDAEIRARRKPVEIIEGAKSAEPGEAHLIPDQKAEPKAASEKKSGGKKS